MDTDVLVAGAGPNGLLLACELQLAGVRPIVLERLAERSQAPKANGIVGQVAHLLDQRGLYQKFTGTDDQPQPSPWFMFGGLPLALNTVDNNSLYGLPIQQRKLEQLLEEHALGLGVRIERGHELLGFTQDQEGVHAEIAGPDGEYRIDARYLAGCDGAHSVVRKEAGIDFPGMTRSDTISRTAHVSLPEAVIRYDTAELEIPGYGRIPAGFSRTEHGVFICAILEPGKPLLGTVEWDGPAVAEDAPMSLDELRDSVRRVLGGAELPFGEPTAPGPHQLRRLVGQNTRLAERYCDGRVFLVGDAAHTHSAVGGPGLNLGMQDAANLGWKLAATIDGWAPQGLLETYHSERHPVAERVVMHTQAQSALLAPGSEVTALRTLFGELLAQPSTAGQIADLLSGADVRYPLNASGPVTGRFVPDFDLVTEDGPTRLAELTRAAKPLLLDLNDARLSTVVEGWQDRITVITGQSADAPAACILLRPDGFAAFSADRDAAPEDVHSGLKRALHDWFGAASVPGSLVG